MRSMMRLPLSVWGRSGSPVAAPTVACSHCATRSVPGPASTSVPASRTWPTPPPGSAGATLFGAVIRSVSEVTSVLYRSAQSRDQPSLYEYEEHQHRNGHHRGGGHDASPVRVVRLVEHQQRHRQGRLRSVADDE